MTAREASVGVGEGAERGQLLKVAERRPEAARATLSHLGLSV